MTCFRTLLAATMALVAPTVEVIAAEETEDEIELRRLWDDQGMFDSALRMDAVGDWAGLPPGAITVVEDSVDGNGALEVPLALKPAKHLRIENNFVAGHRDGFRNMMCMGIQVENFVPYRSLAFSVRTRADGPYQLLFRIWDRTGGWVDWTVPHTDAASWSRVVLTMPEYPTPLIDLERVGGIMVEVRAGEQGLRGTMTLDHLELLRDREPGIAPNDHPIPDASFDMTPEPLVIAGAYDPRRVELIVNMSALELPLWENDLETTMRCLEEELQRLRSLEHLTLYINPGTRRPIDEDPDYLPRTQTTLTAVARYCETKGIPFYQMTGVEGFGFYPPEMMFAIEQAAPTMCLGFLFGEASVETNGHVDYLATLLEYLASKRKRCLYYQQTSYWMGVMQHNEGGPARLLKLLQNPRYKDVFVPMWENLLPAAQGLCYGTTLGMWRGGLTSDWGVSAQSWGYANLNLGGTADMPGHWWLRMFIQAVTTGGRFVEIEPAWPFDGENTEGQVRHSKQWAHNTRWIGDVRAQLLCDLDPGPELRALRLFDRLLSAGIVRSPASPARLMSLPNISLKVVETETVSPTRYRWGIFRRALDEDWWSMSDCPNSWEMALHTDPLDAFGDLYHSSHLYDQTVPQTDHGIVSIVPPGSKLPDTTRIIVCDGRTVYENGAALGVKEAHDLIVEAFANAAESLPFRATGCFLSVVEVAPSTFIAYLLDPEERFPTGVQTTLQIGVEGTWQARDLLSGDELAIAEGAIQVQIPAGGFRVLELTDKVVSAL